MKKYIVYDKKGSILRTGQCANESLKAQACKDEFVTEGIANDLTHKIKNGKVVDR